MRTGDYTSQGCSEGKAMTQSKRAAWIEQPVWMEVMEYSHIDCPFLGRGSHPQSTDENPEAQSATEPSQSLAAELGPEPRCPESPSPGGTSPGVLGKASLVLSCLPPGTPTQLMTEAHLLHP